MPLPYTLRIEDDAGNVVTPIWRATTSPGNPLHLKCFNTQTLTLELADFNGVGSITITVEAPGYNTSALTTLNRITESSKTIVLTRFPAGVYSGGPGAGEARWTVKPIFPPGFQKQGWLFQCLTGHLDGTGVLANRTTNEDGLIFLDYPDTEKFNVGAFAVSAAAAAAQIVQFFVADMVNGTQGGVFNVERDLGTTIFGDVDRGIVRTPDEVVEIIPFGWFAYLHAFTRTVQYPRIKWNPPCITEDPENPDGEFAGDQPCNCHSRFQQYRVAYANNGIRFRQSAHSIPTDDDTDRTVTQDGSDAFPDLSEDVRGFLRVVFQRGLYSEEAIFESVSHDDGLTWNDPVSIFSAGTFPSVCWDARSGCTLYACYSDGNILGKLQNPGDASPGSQFTFLDETSTAIEVDEAPFEISPSRDVSGRWLLVVRQEGSIHNYASHDDGQTWNEIT